MSARSGTEKRRMSRLVGVRLTPDEYAQLERWAAAWLISIPDLLRTVAFDSPYGAEFAHANRDGAS